MSIVTHILFDISGSISTTKDVIVIQDDKKEPNGKSSSGVDAEHNPKDNDCTQGSTIGTDQDSAEFNDSHNQTGHERYFNTKLITCEKNILGLDFLLESSDSQEYD